MNRGRKEVNMMEINKETLIAIRWMVIEIKQVMEESQKMQEIDKYDEEYYLRKINNVIENLDNLIGDKKNKTNGEGD